MRSSLLLVLALAGCFVDEGNMNATEAGTSTDGSSSSTGEPTGEPSMCGDGLVQGGEVCDDGPQNTAHGACGPLCLPNFCGDGHAGPADACDDGNKLDTDLCRSDCTAAYCGDGVVQPGETCDDGNLLETDDCTTKCGPPVCGDGVVSPPDEACDLGDANADDGHCTTSCQKAICGDGLVELGEACEAPTAGCDAATCRWTTCDGVMVEPYEQCDGDEKCTDFCTIPRCGDGHLAIDELCDDGNTRAGDDCTPSCKPSICGDGTTASDELCDDPTLELGGCNLLCERDAYFVFATSETFQGGEVGGLDGADDLCTDLAKKADLPPGEYRAWLSDGDSSPATRFRKTKRPYILPPGLHGVGVVVAQDFAELVDGELERPISVTEKGVALATGKSCEAAATLAWTHTDATGGPLASASDCGAWKFNVGSVGAAGLINSDTASWSDGCPEVSCGKALHLYCVEQPP